MEKNVATHFANLTKHFSIITHADAVDKTRLHVRGFDGVLYNL